MNVSGRAPRARPRRVISAKPRVINAARAFRPSASPSHRPVAIASTFFTAPPTSTPTMSSLAYTRTLGLWKAATSASRTLACSLAATSAVGWLRATSCAKLGPLSTPERKVGATCAHTSWASKPASAACAPVGDSKPLHSQATGMLRPCSAVSMPRSAAMGVATMTRSAPWHAATGSPLATCKAGGKAMPGR